MQRAFRAAVAMVCLALPSAALRADVVAHWAFDETSGTTAHDSVGGWHGTLQGGATWDPGGIAGGAIRLGRATNDLVNMGDVLPLWQAGDFSVAAWVLTTSSDPETFVVAKHLSTQAAGYVLGTNRSGSVYGAPGKAFFYNHWDSANSTTTVTDGQWHHLVGVHHAGGLKEIYVDGAPAEHSIPSYPVNPNTAPLLIGGLTYAGVPRGSYTGLIDDVQIYDYALTPDEVQFLFDNPGGPIPSVPWVRPARVENSGPWRMQVLSGTFVIQPGATARLLPTGGGPEVRAVEPSVQSGRLTATYDLTRAPTGPYDLLVTNPDGSSGTAPRALTVAAAQPPSIASVSPAVGGNTGTVTATVTGQHLNPFAQAKLARSGWQDIVAETISGSDDGTQLTTRFDLRGAAPGAWDLIVTNPNAGAGGSPGAFAIEQGGAPELWVEVTGPDLVRAGRPATFRVTVGNRGRTDAYDLLVWATAPEGAQVSLGFPAPNVPGLTVPPGPAGVQTGAGVVAPIWLLKLGAGSSYTFPVVVTPSGAGGTRLPVSANVSAAPPSAFSASGDIEDVESSPVFQAIAQAAATHAPAGASPDLVRESLKHLADAAWEYAVPTTTVVGAVIGTWICPGVGTLIGAEAGAAVGMLLSAWHLFQAGELLINPVHRLAEAGIVLSWDPNHKAGPSGASDDRYARRAQALEYLVHYENDAEKATAAAAEVHITDQLDPNLGWSTYAITGIQIGDVSVTVPPGAKTLSTTVPAVVKLKDLNDPNYPNCPPQDTNVNIEVNCQFNPATGLAEWHFVGRDPTTGELADFLPPNVWEEDPATTWDDNVAPHGEGWVSYSCKPKADLPSGTRIENIASIVFDVNPPMETNLVFNTIDAGTPTSQVGTLPAQSPASFPVNWSGADEENGSGIAGYDIYVSDNGTPYQLWLSGTPDTSATYNGQDGHLYRFFSLARDNVGHVEAWPMDPDAETTVVVSQEATLTAPAFAPNEWCRFSVPLTPNEPSPDGVLGELGQANQDWWLSYYDADTYYYYPDSQVPAFAPGLGYWLYPMGAGPVTVTGTLVDTSAPCPIPRTGGWSVFANPHDHDVPWSDAGIQVQVGVETKPLSEAVAAGWVDGTIYDWVAGGDVPCGPGEGNLQPWRGYWLYAYQDCTLLCSGTAGTLSATEQARPRRKPTESDWRIRLAGRVGEFRDDYNYAGVLAQPRAPTDTRGPETPLFKGVSLCFAAPDGRVPEGARGLAMDLRQPLTQKTAWDIEVSTDQKDTPVTVSWPDLTELPKTYKPMLVDVATGTRRAMRTTVGYTYNSGESGGTRQFRLEVEPNAQGSVLISGLTAALARSGAWDIGFNLSADAAVSAQVYNIAGRRVADIATSQELARGRASLAWNARSVTDTHVPSGVYLLRVTARTEEGEQASAVTVVQVRR